MTCKERLKESDNCYILVTKNGLMVQGSDIELLGLLSTEIVGLKENIDEDEIKYAVEIAFKTQEQRDEIISKKIEELFKNLEEVQHTTGIVEKVSDEDE